MNAKHKFKVGDKVVIFGRDNITGILSDNLLELEDGANVPNQAALENALWNNAPLTIHALEEDGYILKLGRKVLYGIHHAEEFSKKQKP